VAAKELVDAAQSRIEKHLTDSEKSRGGVVDGSLSPVPGGAQGPILGLSVLSDLQSMLQSHITAIQGLKGSLEMLVSKGFSEAAMTQMEWAFLVLLSLIEPHKFSPRSTVAVGAVPPVTPRSTTSVTDELQKILADMNVSDAVGQIVVRLSQGGFTLDEAAEMILKCLDMGDMVAMAKGLIDKGHLLLAQLESIQTSPGCKYKI